MTWTVIRTCSVLWPRSDLRLSQNGIPPCGLITHNKLRMTSRQSLEVTNELLGLGKYLPSNSLTKGAGQSLIPSGISDAARGLFHLAPQIRV